MPRALELGLRGKRAAPEGGRRYDRGSLGNDAREDDPMLALRHGEAGVFGPEEVEGQGDEYAARRAG